MREIFVFGSNLAGRHGKGAALHAARQYRAEYGVGEGLTGSAYAIPTKGHYMEVRSLNEIEQSVITFLAVARDMPNERFLLTPIGTGLAGHKKKDILAIFKKHGLPTNVVLTSTWVTQ